MIEPVPQFIILAVVPVEMIPKKHELRSRQAITSGDVIGEWSTDGVVGSQGMRNGVDGCAPVAK